MGFPTNCAQCREMPKLSAMKKFFRAARMAKIFGFWRGKKIFRFCGWQKLTDVRRLKKECGVLGSVYIFFRFFRGARRKAKIPTMGQGRKFFIFF